MRKIFNPGRRILSITRTYTFGKILMVSLSVAVLSIILVSAIALRLYETELEKQKMADTGMLTMGMAKELKEFWTKNTDQMGLLTDAIITLKLKPAEFTPLFSEMVARSPSFEAVSYFSLTLGKEGAKAVELATSDPRPSSGKGTEWPGAVENGLLGKGWSSGVMFDQSNVPFVIISIPVNFIQGDKGLLLARVSLKKLWRWLDELNIQPDTNLSVLTADSGLVVADQGRNGLKQKYAFWGAGDGANSFKTGSVLVSYQRVEGTPLLIATATTLAPFTEHLYLVRDWMYGAAVIVFIAAGVFSAERAVKITGPLEQLVADIEEYSRDQTALVSPNLPGEYGKISHAFNEMAKSIAANQALLVQKERMAAVGNVLSGIAHEIRYSVNTLLNLVDEVYQGDEKAMHLSKNELRNLSEKISDMLLYGRDFKVGRESVELNAMILEAVEREKPRAASKHCSIEFEDRGEELVVNGDNAKLVMALSNLIRNAVECDKPGMAIKITAEKAGEGAVVSVKDDGPGIDPEHMDKISLPFYTTRGRGFGLGLYIVNSVMKAHNGRIEIRSKLGEGSEFRMVFEGRA